MEKCSFPNNKGSEGFYYCEPKYRSIFDKIVGFKNEFSGTLKDSPDYIIDAFENLVDTLKSKTMHLNTFKEETGIKMETFKDDFEIYFEQWKDNLNCVAEKIKDGAVDVFEDLICKKDMIAAQTNDLFEEANCAFECFIQQIDDKVEEEKCRLKREMCLAYHQVYLKSKRLLNDLIHYCEGETCNFLEFSEKRMACFLFEAKVFYSEVVDSLVRGYEDRLPCDNLCLEINSSRYAYNVTMSEVNTHVIRALLTMDQERCDWVQMAARLKYFMPIMTNYIRSEAAQRDCLAGIEDAAATHPHVFDNAVKIVHYLYDNDVLSEEVILHWYEKPHSDCDMDFATRIRKQMSSFIRWLREADEQSEDED